MLPRNVPCVTAPTRAYLIELSELPLTTSRSRYCRQAMPRLWPFSVRRNSQVVEFHTLMVRSPDADTMYFSSKSTTLTAARCPTSTRLSPISIGDTMSHTAIERSCRREREKEGSKTKHYVLTIAPVLTSQTRTVESLDPLMMTLSSYCRHSTDPSMPSEMTRDHSLHTRSARHSEFASSVN
uniref:Uncharacterized protein n=1 Tax=Anopheles atroparvus TaxID=41427 RepID=A0A182JIZ7_ANOAO